MEADLKRAFTMAGFKLGGGLLLVAAVIGIRIVSVTPSGVEDEIAELEQIEAELAAETARAEAAARAAESTPDESSASAGSGVSEGITRAAPSPTGDERLVSCTLGGTLQFMRAADCAARGGTSKDVAGRRR